ncbi:MAG: EAL domain-containing protein [Lachnospiraceae bacterium]|nr:EAL domain-containing protein [Lachnospiraceae bacterium]
MTNTDISKINFGGFEAFSDKMPGGVFICYAHGNRDIIYANKQVAELFECGSVDEFMELVGGSLKGFFGTTEQEYVINDVKLQLEKNSDLSGYTFYNIVTKKQNIVRVVCHWRMERDEENVDRFFAMLFPHSLENDSQDFDLVTGMFGKKRLNFYVDSELKKAENAGSKYTIVYLNIVNFKLLNIENGTAEGDKCLKILSAILSRIFKESYLARLSDDHFAIFGKYDDIVSRAEIADAEFKDVYGKFYNVFVKFGIYRFEFSNDFDIEKALSRAKIACDYIKKNNASNIVEYSDEIEQIIKTRDYIVRKLDEAIEKEWIKVYFQPVIRSLTGTLCSMESLVRWIDPEIGFLPPDRFISILENERIIHKLDSYMVDRVCRYIRERVNVGLPTIPVSVNFSQMDFMMCDMLKVVEDAVEKYDIPRDYLHIEITESMIASDENMMHQIIDKFKQAGYEIWMDDFGSGYSSLTVLKDYRFDTIKLDMRFLTPFTERSMSIIRSVVTMAKRIGVKTLAEGVETKEQLDFLKKIGCGMIQGYYYGKPEPIESVFEHIFEKNIDIERRKWRHFYETAGFNVIYTAFPLEIIEDDGKNFKTLYMNEAYRKQISTEKLSLEEIDERIYHTGSPLLERYREFANKIEESGEEETFYYTSNGMYIKFTGQAIAECDGHYIIKGSIVNISTDQSKNDTERLDTKARQLNLLFETVMLVNLSENTIVPLFGGFKYLRSTASTIKDLQEAIRIIENKIIHPTERIRCREFLMTSTLKERVERTGRGYITETFRTLQLDGNYQWKEFFIMMIPGTGANEYLYCMKDYTSKETVKIETEEKEVSELAITMKNSFTSNVINIWKNLMWNSNMKFFWKDRDYRFVGVSRAFLDYFGFENDSEVIGKTDNEMDWHIDNEAFNDNESEVINKGRKILNEHGHMIVNGIIRDIIYDKIPIYSDNKVIGLVGIFRDSDDELFVIGGKTTDAKKDPVTGLLNAHALVDYLIDYAAKYNESGLDYGVIIMNNVAFDRIIQSYGKEFADKVLKKIAENINEAAGKTCIISRPKNSIFTLLTAVNDHEWFFELAKNLENSINGINEVDGNSVTMRIRASAKIRSEENVADEHFYELALTEVLKQ